jgi:hypothetical protein
VPSLQGLTPTDLWGLFEGAPSVVGGVGPA